jgi:hypothetical protein
MTFFKHWLFLNENIEENFNKWLEMAFQYAKGNEKRLLRPYSWAIMSPDGGERESVIGVDPKTLSDADKESLHSLINQQTKDIIKNVLKEKNVENYNWFAFSLGFLISKDFQIHQEDLELAIDITKQRVDNGELPKTEIGIKGWMTIGAEAQQYVDAYIVAQQEISNRTKLKMKKKGETLGDDERYVKLIESEKNIKVYFIPAIEKGPSLDSIRQNALVGAPLDKVNPDDKTLKDRQMILCKYGKGTVWCTANPQGTYHSYYSKNNIYTIHIDDKPAYQFVDCNDDRNHQFMDVDNTPVKELEGDVYDILNKNLKSKIKCYNLSRSYSFDELMNSEDNSDIYKNIGVKNISSFIERMDENQLIEVLRNLIKYKHPSWFESPSAFLSYDQDKLLQSFIKKLGAQKVIDEFSEKMSNAFKEVGVGNMSSFVIKNILSSDPGNIYQILKDNIDIIKKSNLNSDVIEKIINEFGRKDHSKEREKTIVLLGPEVLNNLDEHGISSVVAQNTAGSSLNVLETILDNRTIKITGKLVEFILKQMMLNNFNYQIKFLKWLLSKDISTSAVVVILKWYSGMFGGAFTKATKNIPENYLESIFELIGSDRITKIKKPEILSIYKYLYSYIGGMQKEKFFGLIKQYHKKINLSSPEEEPENEGST